MNERVEVSGKFYEVFVDREAPSKFTAIGEFMGEYLQGKGPTRGSAIRSWKEQARYKANDGPASSTSN
jgi:hypothetical protein